MKNYSIKNNLKTEAANISTPVRQSFYEEWKKSGECETNKQCYNKFNTHFIQRKNPEFIKEVVKREKAYRQELLALQQELKELSQPATAPKVATPTAVTEPEPKPEPTEQSQPKPKKKRFKPEDIDKAQTRGVQHVDKPKEEPKEQPSEKTTGKDIFEEAKRKAQLIEDDDDEQEPQVPGVPPYFNK